MTSLPNIKTIKNSILEKLTTTAGAITVLLVLCGTASRVGMYYQEIISEKEIMRMENKQTLELLEIRTKQSLEIIELQKKISLLEIQNEKGRR